MVDKKTVEYVANLARVNISEEEKAWIVPQLSQILDYIDKLKELNVDYVESTRGAVTEENVLRPDSPEKKNFSTHILKNSPSQEDNHFKIPKVIE